MRVKARSYKDVPVVPGVLLDPNPVKTVTSHVKVLPKR